MKFKKVYQPILDPHSSQRPLQDSKPSQSPVTHLRVTGALAFFTDELSHITTLSLTHARRCVKGSAGLPYLRLKSPLTTLTTFTRTRQKTLLSLLPFVSTPPLVPPSPRLSLLCQRTFIFPNDLKAQNIHYKNTQHRSYHPSASRSRKADERWQIQLNALQELGQLGKRVQQRNEEKSRPGEKLRSEEWQEILIEGAAEGEGGLDNRTGNNRTPSMKGRVILEEPSQETFSASTPLNQGLFRPPKPGALPSIIIPRKSPYSLSSIPEEVIFYSAGPRMHSFYQILCTPTADTPGTTILLHFEGNRYIFGNVPEGTQRMMVAQHVKITNVRNVFISGQTKWSNTGGVLGFALCLADANASAAESTKQVQRSKGITPEVKALRRLGIHGGPNITHTIATARRFIFRKGTPMDVHEYGPFTETNLKEPSFSDEYINVWAMPISPSNQGASPKSPRKRSFDDFRESKSHMPLESTQVGKEDKEGAQEIRRAVVKEMFDSSWRHDALFETNLTDVSLPAALFIRNCESNKIEPYKGKLPGDPDFPTDEPVTVLVRKPWPAAEINELPSTSPCREALSYIIKDHTQRGVFVTKKAIDLGIPKGPLYKEISEGRNITLPDGRTITPDMVLGEPRWSVGIAILDVPSPEYIEDMVSRPEWKSEKIMKGVNTIIWILGTSVVSDTRWIEFVDSMKTVEHIVASQDAGHNYLGLENMAAASIRRHALDPDHFPMPVHEPSPNASGSDKLESLPKNLRSASRNLILQTRPKQRIKTDEIPTYLNANEVMQSVPDAVVQLGSDARSAMNDQRNTEDLVGDDVEIITLGTGSALPSKYRNVSGTLIRVPGQGSYLLDCGEGTLNQMRRVFPPQELKEVLRSLKMIWISHMHADHHLGTTSVIKAWYDEFLNSRSADEELQNGQTDQNGHDFEDDLVKEPRLFVASTSPMISWLREYSDVEDFGFHKIVPLTVSDKFINKSSNKIFWNSHFLDFNSSDSPITNAVRTAIGLQTLAACPVLHCRGSKGVALTFPSGFKASYSGDCRPSNKFIAIGQDSTVLLHEATFEDELMGDAKAKLHSTISEALGVAVQMRAKRVILTHFSQRYHKLPMMQNLNREVMAGAGTAGAGEREEEREQESYDGPIDAAVGEYEMDVDVDVVSKHSIDAVDSNFTVNPTTTTADSGPPPSHPLATDDDEHPLGTDNDVILKSPQTSPKTSTSTVFPDIQPPPVALAFDYMRVRVRDIEHMHRFTPALLELYDISGEGKGDGEDGGVDIEGGGTRAPSRKDIQNVNRKKSGGGLKNGGDLRKGGPPGTPVEKVKEGEDEGVKGAGLAVGGGKSEEILAWGLPAVFEGPG